MLAPCEGIAGVAGCGMGVTEAVGAAVASAGGLVAGSVGVRWQPRHRHTPNRRETEFEVLPKRLMGPMFAEEVTRTKTQISCFPAFSLCRFNRTQRQTMVRR